MVRFDDSLTRFVDTVQRVLGDGAFEQARAVRDSYGRLAYLSTGTLDQKDAKQLQRQLERSLGPYAAQPAAVLDADQIGVSILLKAPTVWRQVQTSSGSSVWVDVVDRRIVGQDWITPPLDEPDPTPPRLVCASMKGGVGRSTAVCVLAVHLAQLGHNVLVVDADLEAPGLGAFLLPGDSRPLYGLMDYLVENGLGGWDPSELEQFVGTSLLTDRSAGQGLVDVVPAIGRRSLENAPDVLSKLSRAMLEDPIDSGPPKSVRDQLREFIDVIARRREYGAVLIDARAGFSEIAAGVLLGLGATVLLFGVNQAQTFEDYRFLLAHLAHLPIPNDPERDWRRRLRFVHAKADPQGDDIPTFRDRLYEVVAEEFYEVENDEGEGAFVYSVDDPQAPHAPLVINFDFPYMRFEPARNASQLRKETYLAGFASFVADATTLLGIGEMQ